VALCPHISSLHYKKLCDSIIELSILSYNHYFYRDIYYLSVKTVRLDKLKKFLEENNLWQE